MKRRMEAPSGLAYEVLESTNLVQGSWAPSTGLVVTVISTSEGFEDVEITKPDGWADSTDKTFIKIKVSN